MKKYIYVTIIIFTGVYLSSCEKFLEPEKDNFVDEEYLKNNPAYAEGLLLTAYLNLPRSYDLSIEAATDDAVTNNFSLSAWEMASGQWSSMNNPIAEWWSAYRQIFYINSFIDIKDDVLWQSKNERANELHLKRLTGEAYGLRAWYHFMLLRSHAGPGPDGTMLGFPITTQVVTINDDWQVPRNTYDECVAQIIEDCDLAIANLPDKYTDITGDYIYNSTMGARWNNRLTGSAMKALKSRVLLYAASPAFNIEDNASKWESTAISTGDFLNENGGLSALSPTGLNFWIYPSGGPTDADVIWGSSIVSHTSLEKQNFPPSLFGQGEINPSQELVNAFPMANGYPIGHPSGGYNTNAPYSNRDPRLDKFIIRDSSVFGAKGIIRTHVSAIVDGIDQQTNSTRTGYYLKKLLIDKVLLFPIEIPDFHFYCYARYTEMILNYAESANEAWGPDNGGSTGITARQAIGAVRQRAGIAQPDEYLASVTSKEEMRTLIRNERRIELCFEGHRFYDIRRWNDKSTMKAPVSKIIITTGTPNEYNYQIVEQRVYQDHMIYGPIPYSEILKYSGLIQNQGW